jgi:formamidopyrimidine-DNA glycosylase
LADGGGIVFSDFRRFGRVVCTAHSASPYHETLGPDALTSDFCPETLDSQSTRSIKSALLDQRTVAGLGNIYACESLFRAGIAPSRPVHSLTAQDRARLVRAIKSILRAAISRGGSTLDDYRNTEGEAGDYDRQFAVFRREGRPCPGCTCSTGVLRVLQSGRSTYYCATKQT